MNYDHRFHAGNFADVFKHIVLTRVLLYLQRKPTPFRLIETHAGYGIYDLGAEASSRTLEWQAGVGRLDASAFTSAARGLIQPYLDHSLSAPCGAVSYPGSPALAMRLLRPADRMIFCELHPDAFAALKTHVRQDKRAKAVALDGYVGLNAFLPPVERRGLVLIDPPFETDEEFERIADAVIAAHAKWREGILLVWYPIKGSPGIDALKGKILEAQIRNVICVEFQVDVPRAGDRLAANGLLLVNPPYTLEAEMACVLPELQRQLAPGRGGWRIDRLAAE